MEEGRMCHLCQCTRNTRHLWLVSIKQSSQMLGCLWASYLRVEPGKSCCSHSRFQWSELVCSCWAWTPADVLFSKAPDKALLSPMALLPICGLERLLLLLSFLISSTFHLLFSLTDFNMGACRVWFSLQCQVPPGQPESLQQRAKHPALPRRWWGRFALIMLINALDAVE